MRQETSSIGMAAANFLKSKNYWEFGELRLMSDEIKSLMIEGLMIRAPITIITMTRGYGEKEIILQGGNIIYALTEYIENEFALREGCIFKEIASKKFSELEPQWQSRIRNASISHIILADVSEDELKIINNLRSNL